MMVVICSGCDCATEIVEYMLDSGPIFKLRYFCSFECLYKWVNQ